VGDIRQPWIDLGSELGISPFTAKALFALGMMRRYVLSANAVLKDLRHQGFVSAYGLLSSGVELLGRCIHPDKRVRQDPVSGSKKRLEKGFDFIRQPHLQPSIVVQTNYYGYTVQELIDLRNLAVHGGCLAKVPQIKGDIELLHELRKAFYGVPVEETDPRQGRGPVRGAIDRYYEILASGDSTGQEMRERLASAGITPAPLSLQGGAWPFVAKVINETRVLVQENLRRGYPPISGDWRKACDCFQLYP